MVNRIDITQCVMMIQKNKRLPLMLYIYKLLNADAYAIVRPVHDCDYNTRLT